MTDEVKNDKVIRRKKEAPQNINKANGAARFKKPWYKNKNKKHKKKFSIASNESLQQLAEHFNQKRY